MRSTVIAVALVAALALAALVHPSNAGAQEQWDVVLDLPSGDVYDATFATDDVAWAVGAGGIFRSEDRGRSWAIVRTSPTFLSQIAAAPGGAQGWATGILGNLLYTADSGRTWSERDAGTEVNLGPIVALDADTAIVAGAGIGVSDVIMEPEPHTVRRTDDAGATWRELDVDGFRASDIEFVDGERGWIAGVRCDAPEQPFRCESHSYAVLRTDDGGTTWQSVNEDSQFSALDFVTPDTGWGVRRYCDQELRSSCTTGIAITDDGGETWEDVRIIPNAFNIPIAALDADTLIASESTCDANYPECGYQIIETGDRGETWEVVDPARARYASHFAFAPAGHGLALADQDVLTTEDRRTWTPATFPITTGSGAYDFIDAKTGWFAASKLLHTTDAGATWQPVGDLQPVDLEFVSANEGWASTFAYDPANGAQSVSLQHTVDGGRTWTPQYERAFGNYLYIDFADARNGWAYSLYDGLLLHTRDGGASWYEQPLPVDPDGNSPAITFVDARVAWLIEPVCVNFNDDCVIRPWVTRDGGDTWRQAIDIPYLDSCPLGIEAASATTAWITASECSELSGPYVLRTTDGGASWARTDFGAVGQVGPLAFFGPRTGRAFEAVCTEPPGACTDVLLRTEDGGVSWTRTPTGISETFTFDYEFVAPERAWRLLQSGGGLFAVSRHQLHRFTGPGPDQPPSQPPIQLPDTGTSDVYRDDEGHVQFAGVLLIVMAAAAAAAYILRRRAR